MRFTVMQTASLLRMDLGAQDPNTRGGIFDDVRELEGLKIFLVPTNNGDHSSLGFVFLPKGGGYSFSNRDFRGNGPPPPYSHNI